MLISHPPSYSLHLLPENSLARSAQSPRETHVLAGSSMPSFFWWSEKIWAQLKCDKGRQQKTALGKVYWLLCNLTLPWQIRVHMYNVCFPCTRLQPLLLLLSHLLQQLRMQFLLASDCLCNVPYSFLWEKQTASSLDLHTKESKIEGHCIW